MRRIDQYFFSKHLEEDEVVHLLIHKHFFLGIRYLVLPALLFAGTFTLFGMAAQPLLWYGLGLGCVVLFVWLLRNFFDYYLDAWIITNQGIIDVEWHGWFHRQSARVLYSDINGVSYEIHGVLGTLLNYGTISVEKISTGVAISMDHVHNPRRIEMSILKYMETYLHTRNLKDSRQVQDVLASLVAKEIHKRDFQRSTSS